MEKVGWGVHMCLGGTTLTYPHQCSHCSVPCAHYRIQAAPPTRPALYSSLHALPCTHCPSHPALSIHRIQTPPVCPAYLPSACLPLSPILHMSLSTLSSVLGLAQRNTQDEGSPPAWLHVLPLPTRLVARQVSLCAGFTEPLSALFSWANLLSQET